MSISDLSKTRGGFLYQGEFLSPFVLIGKLNIFYKKVFRSTPPRRGDRLILVSRGPVKSQIRSVSVLYIVHCTCTVPVLNMY